MDLRDQLNSEASAFVERLIAVSEAAAQRVRADADRQVATVRTEADEQLAAARSAADDLRARVEALEADANRTAVLREADAETVRRLQSEIAETERASQSLLDGISREAETLRAEAARAQTEAEAFRQESETHRLEAETLRTKAEALHIEAAALRAEGSRLRADAVTAASELHRLQDHLEALRVTEQIQRDHTHRVEARVVELEATVATLGTDLDDANELTDATHAELSAIRATNRRLSTMLSGSVAALDALAGATTVGEVFNRLVSQLAGEFDRAAIFRLNGRHLQGDVGVGVDESSELSEMVIPIDGSSLISRAAGGSLEHAVGKEAADSRPPFGGTPALAIAAPLLFQGETLAVVYADADGPVTDGHGPFAAMLVRHANLLLSRLTQELKVARELRDYAQMLLREAEQMLLADIEAGRTDHDRERRLRDTIDCARQLYAQRAALEGPFAADLLEQQIAVILEEDPSTPFATELADLVRHPRAQRTA